jgi:ParB-like chromosome segregation protein Spo0J
MITGGAGVGGKKHGPPGQPREEKWPLRRLKENPLQKRYFGDVSAEDLKALAANVALRGLRQPIEALPDGTILNGHMRLKALQMNGAAEAAVLVRYDLAGADEVTRERVFIEENLLRRQFDPLAKARAVPGLFLAEKKKSRSRLFGREEEEARDRVGAAIGMSGRNLNRYFAVLAAPTEVQEALRARALTLVTAARVAGLPAAVQQRIARRIGAGEPARAVVAEHLPESDGRHRKVADAVASFARSLGKGLHDLAGRLPEVRPGQLRQHVGRLREASEVIGTLRPGRMARRGGNRPHSGPPSGLDAARHAAAQRAAHQAVVLRDGPFSALMAAAVGLDRHFETAAHRIYLDRVLKDLGDPADPIERVLVEQLCMAHFRTAQLHVGAGQAQGAEAVKLYSAVAARMLGEMRRTALALKAYRTGAPAGLPRGANLKLFKAAQ